jgi:hypothetical protein
MVEQALLTTAGCWMSADERGGVPTSDWSDQSEPYQDKNVVRKAAPPLTIKFADDILQGVAEIGQFLKEPPRRVHDLLARGLLPAWQDGRLWRMRKSTYLALIAQREAIALERALSSASGTDT